MGAWGTGIFDDDMAFEIIDEIKNSHNQTVYFRSAFENSIGKNEYLEYDDGYRVIISAVFIDGIVNGNKYDADGIEIDEWTKNYNGTPVKDLCNIAKQALKKVISQGSELNELWLENKEQYNKWSINIKLLLDRL
jgi:hypothetical protein